MDVTFAVMVLAGTFLLSLIVLAVTAIYFMDQAFALARDSVAASLGTASRIATAATVAQSGLNPHVVDPETFAPQGMNRKDAPKPVDVEPEPEIDPEDDDADLKQAEADFARFQATRPTVNMSNVGG